MKKIICLLSVVFLFSCFGPKDKDAKKNIIINKGFEDENTFLVECRGFPKESLKGRARIESAKEAALINAQVFTRQLFDDSVDVIRNGTVKEFVIEDDHAVIHYVVKYKGLNRHYKERP